MIHETTLNNELFPYMEVLNKNSACMKHQSVIHALSALYDIYSTAKVFKEWLHHAI